MKKFFAAVGALGLSSCLPNEAPNHIVVEASATDEFAPDAFYISGEIRARDESNIVVLQNLSERLDLIRTRLVEVENIEKIEIVQDDVNIWPVYEIDCYRARDYELEESCEIEKYLGAVSVSVRASPASVAGGVFSFLSELGVEEVELGGYLLLDYEAAHRSVLQEAVKKARIEADRIASAAGASVIGPMKIQVGDGFRKMFDELF